MDSKNAAAKTPRPVEIGDRFADKDWRNEGRIIEVIGIAPEDRHGIPHFLTRTEVHPNNPSAVGRTIRVSATTIAQKYKRVSR
jgi:hypothetical protein